MTRWALGLILCACTPTVTQTTRVRDPHLVTVFDSHDDVLLPAGAEARVATTSGATALLSRSRVTVQRDEAGLLWVGRKPLVDATGTAISVQPGNVHPSLEPQRFRDDFVYQSRPVREGRGEITRLTLATPLSNVLHVEEVREPTFSGVAIVFGSLLIAAGSALIVDAATRTSRETGERISELVVSPLFLAPGVFAFAADIYGLVTPRTQRVLYDVHD